MIDSKIVKENNNEKEKEKENLNDNSLEISKSSTFDGDDIQIINEDKEKDKNFTPFEESFQKYYVDSSQNSNGNFDNYLKSGLKLISLFPNVHYEKEIENISNSFNLLENKSNKKTLILDLDETLIHSDLDLIYKNHIITLYFDSEDEDEKNIPIPLILRMKKIFLFL